MTLLTLQGMTVRRDCCPVVDGVSLSVAAGECVGLIGPNGAGKSTLLRGALGLLPIEGRSSLAELPANARARTAAWLPQAREVAWPVAVETLVALGRTPHRGPRGMTAADRVAVDRALERMGLDTFRHRDATALSGGEQARVLIARALAQETPLLIADEPIAGLDPAAQIRTMEVFARLAHDGGHAVITALHDLSLAARLCTRLLLMARGRLVADGPPEAVLTEANLAEVFGLSARVEATAEGLFVRQIGVID